MRKKDTFTKRISCEYNEMDTIVEFLEEKAAEGWELTSKTGVVWGFRRAQPRKVKFNVEVVDLDNTSIDLNEFIAFCEADGWKHVFDAGMIQVFENEDLDAEPIHTDLEVKLKIVHDKCKATRIMVPIVFSIVFVPMMCKAYLPLDIQTLVDITDIGYVILLPLLSLILLSGAVDYLIWYRKAKMAVDVGESPVYKRTRWSKVVNILAVFVVAIAIFGLSFVDAALNDGWFEVAVLAAIVVVAFVVFWIIFPKVSAKYNKQKISNDIDLVAVGIVLTLLVLFFIPAWLPGGEKEVKAPLTLQDLSINAVDEDPYLRCEKSPLLTHYEYGEFTDDYSLDYDIYITEYQKVYDVAVEHWTVPAERHYEMYEDPADVEALFHYEEVKEPAFGADKVYYNERNDRRLLLYPDRVVRLDAPDDLTEEQIKVIGEKLTTDL